MTFNPESHTPYIKGFGGKDRGSVNMQSSEIWHVQELGQNYIYTVEEVYKNKIQSIKVQGPEQTSY